MPVSSFRGRTLARAAAVLVALLPAACGQAVSPVRDASSPAPRQAEALPSSHVHGVAVNPADDVVYLATHEGLFRMGAAAERVGPVIDLMGFTVAGPDHFYASGHPGNGVQMPEPVGLIESRDAGLTWTTLSRAGQSDFHTLAASGAGIVAFDGALRASGDGRSWTTLSPPVQPYALAASPDGTVLLATSPQGLVRSTDSGGTWLPVAGAPPLMLVDWADAPDVAVGTTPDGQVAVSLDAGGTWPLRGRLDGAPQALGASGAAGDLRVLAATEAALVDSGDGGATFAPYRPAG
jgi:hypothetical protein